MATDLSLLGEVFVISSLFLLGIGYFLSEKGCLLYTSAAADDTHCVDLGGRRIIKKKK